MTLFFAAVLPIVILFCGLCLDLGMLEMKELQLQTAADAAVLGAQIEAERGTGNWPTISKADAGINGFTNGVNNTTVTVGVQPNYGSYAGRFDAFQATVSQTTNTVFMGALNGGTVTLSAQATSLITPCMYLLGSGAITQYSLDVQTGSLLGNTCPVYVNSEMRIETNGNMAVEATDVAGAASSSSIAGYSYPAISFNVASFSDPLAYVTQPSYSGSCDHTSYAVSSGTVTLTPGNYCNGINLTNCTATLNPGLYIITGRSVWSGSTVTANGVTLFFTHGGSYGYGPFVIYQSSNVTMSAPTTALNGSIPTILIFADRNWVAGYAQDFAFLSPATITMDGIVYVPKAGFEVESGGTVGGTNYLGVVADNFVNSGTQFYLRQNYSNIATGNPFHPYGGLVQ
jgi:Flp pilus assembly protein TadG